MSPLEVEISTTREANTELARFLKAAMVCDELLAGKRSSPEQLTHSQLGALHGYYLDEEYQGRVNRSRDSASNGIGVIAKEWSLERRDVVLAFLGMNSYRALVRFKEYITSGHAAPEREPPPPHHLVIEGDRGIVTRLLFAALEIPYLFAHRTREIRGALLSVRYDPNWGFFGEVSSPEDIEAKIMSYQIADPGGNPLPTAPVALLGEPPQYIRTAEAGSRYALTQLLFGYGPVAWHYFPNLKIDEDKAEISFAAPIRRFNSVGVKLFRVKGQEPIEELPSTIEAEGFVRVKVAKRDLEGDIKCIKIVEGAEIQSPVMTVRVLVVEDSIQTQTYYEGRYADWEAQGQRGELAKRKAIDDLGSLLDRGSRFPLPDLGRARIERVKSQWQTKLQQVSFGNRIYFDGEYPFPRVECRYLTGSTTKDIYVGLFDPGADPDLGQPLKILGRVRKEWKEVQPTEELFFRVPLQEVEQAIVRLFEVARDELVQGEFQPSRRIELVSLGETHPLVFSRKLRELARDDPLRKEFIETSLSSVWKARAADSRFVYEAYRKDGDRWSQIAQRLMRADRTTFLQTLEFITGIKASPENAQSLSPREKLIRIQEELQTAWDSRRERGFPPMQFAVSLTITVGENAYQRLETLFNEGLKKNSLPVTEERQVLNYLDLEFSLLSQAMSGEPKVRDLAIDCLDRLHRYEGPPFQREIIPLLKTDLP